jgi:hypothetical protein
MRTPVRINMLHNGGPSDYVKNCFDMEFIHHHAHKRGVSDLQMFMRLALLPRIAGGSGTLSNYAETKVIDHTNNKATFAALTTVALALCTTTPDSSKTGSTIAEATAYTGYARATVPAASFNAATAGGAGAASTTATNASITFAACTAGSAVIIGWALCDNATTATGNVLWWGSATSTTISITQTPATVASGGLTESLT